MAGEYVLSVILSATDRASGIVTGFLKSLGPIGGVAAVAGAALVGLGVEATKQAADFQTAMLSNVAHAGLAQSEFQHVSDAILAMAPAVGRAPTQLAEAMYPILSAFSGIQNQSAKSAIALDTLKMSFQTVAGTTVDGTAVANAAVGTFNALGMATDNVSTNTKRMTGLFDVMDKTVQLGNMQWDAYKNVVSKLAVGIQGTNISFNESQAALATLTNRSYSAQRASTYLNNTFTTMVIKTDAMAKHAKKLGISFDEQKYSSMNLAEKIEYLNKVTGGNSQKVLALLGNNATALKTFNALKGGIKDYQSALDSLNHSQGALKASFDEASKGMNFQMSQMKAAGDALMISIGTQLLPVVSDFVKQLVPLVQQFTTWLVKSGALQVAANMLKDVLQNLVSVILWMATTTGNIVTFFQKNEWAMDALKAVLVAFAIVVAPMVVAALISMAVSAWLFLAPILVAAAPFIALGLVIAAVIFGIIEAYKHWGAIMDWLSNKSEQMRIKTEIQQSQMAVKTDQQQKKAAQNTLKNLEKEKADILAKLKHTNDAATKAELQHQLEMTQRQIDGQNARIKAADADIAKQKARQKQLHDDLIESQKNLGQRMDDAVNAWTKTAEDTFDAWLNTQLTRFNSWRGSFDSGFNSWVGSNLAHLNTWRNNFDSGFNAWVTTNLARFNGWRQSIDTGFNNMVSGAFQYGANLIAQFTAGVQSKIAGLLGTVSNAIQGVKNLIGFHSPAKEGPGSDADTWAPNLMKMYANGIQGGAAGIKVAAKNAMALMKAGFVDDAMKLFHEINQAKETQRFSNITTIMKKHEASSKYGSNTADRSTLSEFAKLLEHGQIAAAQRQLAAQQGRAANGKAAVAHMAAIVKATASMHAEIKAHRALVALYHKERNKAAAKAEQITIKNMEAHLKSQRAILVAVEKRDRTSAANAAFLASTMKAMLRSGAKGVVGGLYADKTAILGDDYQNGTPLTAGGTKGTIIHTTIHVTANDAKHVAEVVQKHLDKQYRMSATHSVVSSGGKR